MKPCRICKTPYEPKPHQLRSHVYTCPPCLRAYDAEKRRRRREEQLASGIRKPRQPASSPDAERRRRWERAHYQNSAERRERVRVRSLARRAVWRGAIKKLPCEMCGSPEVEAHHDDYSRPYEVRWFCQRHHRELHHKQR